MFGVALPVQSYKKITGAILLTFDSTNIENKLKTIAFPAISTGVYGYPKSEASFIALSIAKDYEKQMREIIFCCFSDKDAEIYQSNYIALS